MASGRAAWVALGRQNGGIQRRAGQGARQSWNVLLNNVKSESKMFVGGRRWIASSRPLGASSRGDGSKEGRRPPPPPAQLSAVERLRQRRLEASQTRRQEEREAFVPAARKPAPPTATPVASAMEIFGPDDEDDEDDEDTSGLALEEMEGVSVDPETGEYIIEYIADGEGDQDDELDPFIVEYPDRLERPGVMWREVNRHLKALGGPLETTSSDEEEVEVEEAEEEEEVFEPFLPDIDDDYDGEGQPDYMFAGPEDHYDEHGEGFDSGRFDSGRFDSDRFDSDRFDSDRFDSDRFDSDRFDSDRFDSDRFDIEDVDSEDFGSDRFDSEDFDSDGNGGRGRSFGGGGRSGKKNVDDKMFAPDLFDDRPFPNTPDVLANRVLPLRTDYGADIEKFVEAVVDHPTKFASMQRTFVHKDSTREPLGTVHRTQPPAEFVKEFQKFVLVSGLPHATTVQDNQRILGDFDNPLHQLEVVEAVASLLQVATSQVVPASMTSAFVGFTSSAEGHAAVCHFVSSKSRALSPHALLLEAPRLSLYQHEKESATSTHDKVLDLGEEETPKDADEGEILAAAKEEGEEEAAEEDKEEEEEGMAQRLQNFVERSEDGTILLVENLPPGMSSDQVIKSIFPRNSPATRSLDCHSLSAAKDILAMSATAVLCRVPRAVSAAELDTFLSLPAVQRSLEQVAADAANAMQLFVARRERVFAGFHGVGSRPHRREKAGTQLVVDGDVVPVDFFRHHYAVLALQNVPPHVTAQQLTHLMQPYCDDPRDVYGSIHFVHSLDGGHTGRAYVGWDHPDEAEKFMKQTEGRIVMPLALSGAEENGGGEEEEEECATVSVSRVKEKPLRRGGRPTGPRPARPVEELLQDLNDWQRHLDNPEQDVAYLEKVGGIPREALDDVFRTLRYRNVSMGPVDGAARGERLEPHWRPGDRYALMVRLYIKWLKKCVATPETPDPISQVLLLPGEKFDPSGMDEERDRLALITNRHDKDALEKILARTSNKKKKKRKQVVVR